MQREIIVGTRTSSLALWQTKWVVQQLQEKNPQYKFTIKEIKTKGDKILDVALAKIGDKGLFTKELEIALLSGETDIAVHSMKDVPTDLPDGLTIGAITKRENPCDVLISQKGFTLDELPEGAIIGTSSLRRKAQLLFYRSDLRIVDLRGNLNTRLKKMENENFDGIVLAFAGVVRMGWGDRVTQRLPFNVMLPAVGQGAVGIEVRENDEVIMNLVKSIEDLESKSCINAERFYLKKLEGGCQIPIGALASFGEKGLEMDGVVASIDGLKLIRRKMSADFGQEALLGNQLADELLSLGGDVILNEIRKKMEE